MYYISFIPETIVLIDQIQEKEEAASWEQN